MESSYMDVDYINELIRDAMEEDTSEIEHEYMELGEE